MENYDERWRRANLNVPTRKYSKWPRHFESNNRIKNTNNYHLHLLTMTAWIVWAEHGMRDVFRVIAFSRYYFCFFKYFMEQRNTFACLSHSVAMHARTKAWIELNTNLLLLWARIFSVSLAWLFFYNSTHFHRHIYYQLKAIKQDLSIIFYIYSKIRMHYVYMEVMELNRMRLLYFYAVETVGVCKPWSRVPHWFPYKDRKPLYGNYWGTLLQGLHSIHVKGKEQKYIH